SNSARSTVLSGEREALGRMVAGLQAEGVFCRWVKVDVASHGPQVEELGPELLSSLGWLRPRPGEVALESTVHEREVSGAELTGSYWVSNLRFPVRFASAVERLVSSEHEVFIEMSPHPVLLPWV